MDPTIKALTDQMFAQVMQLGQAQLARENSAWGNVAEQTRLGYLTNVSLADLANGILAQRSAGGQPQSGAGAAGVNTAGTLQAPAKAA